MPVEYKPPQKRFVQRGTSAIVEQRIIPDTEPPRRRSGKLRIVLQPSKCKIRKRFKKTMMKKLAAQVMASGGKGSLARWRTNRKLTNNVQFRC